MSLPSYAYFFYNGQVIFKSFVNVGWFLTDDALLRSLIAALTEYHETCGVQDFDYVEIYSYKFQIVDLISWKRKEISNEDLLKMSAPPPPTPEEIAARKLKDEEFLKKLRNRKLF